MTKRAYNIPINIDPSSLPWVFEGDRVISTTGDGYVEVDGYINGYEQVTLRTPSTVPTPIANIERVTRFQALAALHNAGLLATVEAAMASADPITKLAWDNALTFKRNSPTVTAMMATLNLTEQQVNDLFAAAAIIEV